MRLHVGQAPALRPNDPVEGGDLVQDRGFQLLGVEIHRPPAEADQVRIAGVGADHGPGVEREPDGPPDRQGITGMEAAGHVDGRDEPHERRVVAHRPRPDALAHVRVQVDPRCHDVIVPAVGATGRPSPASDAPSGNPADLWLRDSGPTRHAAGQCPDRCRQRPARSAARNSSSAFHSG